MSRNTSKAQMSILRVTVRSSDAKNNTRTNEYEDTNDGNRPNNKHLKLRTKRVSK